jgi:toxic protein SymE
MVHYAHTNRMTQLKQATAAGGEWIAQAGFTDGMPIKIRVMPDCIVITAQNTRELYGCAEGLSVTYVNRQKMKLWLAGFPGALNDTGKGPVIKRGNGHCG